MSGTMAGMIEVLASVFGLALLDSVNPSALVVTISLLVSSTAYRARVATYLSAVFLASFVLGVVLMLGLGGRWDTVGGWFDHPVVKAGQGIVGAGLLLYGALAPSTAGRPRAAPEPRAPGLGGVFLLGLTITVVEFSTALPYFGAIGLLTDADLSAAAWLPILVAYNVLFVLPPLLLLAAYELVGGRLRDRLDGLRGRLERGSRAARLTVVAVVGFLLLADGLAFFDFFGLVEVPNGS